MARFDSKLAVVTGAAHGIGAASAARLAAEGATVVLADIDAERAAEVAARIRADGGRAVHRQCDVSRREDWTQLRDQVHAEFGPVDVVHSNAFMHLPGSAHAMPQSVWDAELAVNLTPLLHAMFTFHDDLDERGGNIVVTSSVHAAFGLPGNPAYAAAKGGLCAMARQFAVEYGPRIRVNAVLPGPIRTQVWDDVDEAGIEMSARATALDRLGSPEEVAAAVAFLASDDASYITGASLYVDGGWSVKKESL